MILDILYAIFIQPIEWGMGWAFAKSYSLVSSYGLAILLLSLIVNFALIPIYLVSDSWQAQERAIQDRMRSKLDEIKLAFAGQERFMMTRMLYKINHYHPLMAVRSSIGLLIQIPFFFAAYQLISNYDALNNVSFFIFSDLSKPDGLLSIGSWHINLMPFVMTAINLASAYVYASSLSKKDKIQVYVIAGIFLIVLYSMPVALVLYWTMNNLFSLVKLVIYKLYPEFRLYKFKAKKRKIVVKKYQGLFKDGVMIYFAMIIVFLLVPLYMIGNSPEEFGFIDAPVFYRTAILFTVISSLMLLFFNCLLKLLNLYRLSVAFIYFGLAYVIFSGFVFPVSLSTTIENPELNPIDFKGLLLATLVSIFFAVMSLSKYKSYLNVFLLATVTVTTISTILKISDAGNVELLLINKQGSDVESGMEQTHPSLEISNNKNIFVISFDGIPGKIFSEIIKEDKELQRKLKDFTIFENAISSSPATVASLMGDIYGVQDFKGYGDDINTVKSYFRDKDLFFSSYNNLNDVYQYNYPGYGIDEIKINAPASEIMQKQLETFNYFRYPIIRIATSKFLKMLNWSRFNYFHKYVLNSSGSEFDELVEKYNVKGKNFSRALSLNKFERFISSTKAVDKELSVRFLHMYFTHHPVEFDEDCKYLNHSNRWRNVDQDENGLKNMSVCAVNKFSEFLEKLRELDVYDKSLIIFKSDHGEAPNYFKNSPDNIVINDFPPYGYNRYRPTLAIKGIEGKGAFPYFENKIVLLNDIAKTICVKSEAGKYCEQLNGLNLLSEERYKDQPYYIYVAKDQESSAHFRTQISVKVPTRNITLMDFMKESELIKLAPFIDNL